MRRSDEVILQPDEPSRDAGKGADLSGGPKRESTKAAHERLSLLMEQTGTYYEGLHSEWDDHWEFYKGDKQKADIEQQLTDAKQYDLFASDIAIENFAWATIEQFVAILMQSTPSPYAASADGTQEEPARQATVWLQSYARARNMAAQQVVVYRDTVVKGNGVFKVFYDKTRDEVQARAIDPRYVLPDPASDELEGCEFVGIRHVYGMDRAKQLWPKLDEVAAERVSTDLEPDDGIAQQAGRDKVLVHEVYHDFGKRVMVYCGEQVLAEGENPLPDVPALSHRYPLTIVRYLPVPGQFWSEGLLNQLEPMQTDLNKLNLRVRVHHRLTVNPVLVAHGHAKVDTSPGSIIRLNTSDEKAYYLIPPPIPPEVYSTIEGIKAAMDLISGVHGILRGIRPKGVTSGIALEGLAESAQTRMAGQAKAWALQLGDMWLRMLALMQVMYSEPRNLPTLEGNEVGRVAITPGDLSTVEPRLDDETGEPEVDDRTGDPVTEVVPHNFHVLMQAEGELPLSPSAMAEVAIQLAQMPRDGGMVDQQAVLDAVRFPDREKVITRMTQQQQAQMQGQLQGQQDAQAQMDAQAQAAQGAPAGGGGEGAGAGDIVQALQQVLTPEQMQVLEAVMSGEAPPEMLEQLVASVPPEVGQLIQVFVQQMFAQGAGQMQG